MNLVDITDFNQQAYLLVISVYHKKVEVQTLKICPKDIIKK